MAKLPFENFTLAKFLSYKWQRCILRGFQNYYHCPDIPRKWNSHTLYSLRWRSSEWSTRSMARSSWVARGMLGQFEFNNFDFSLHKCFSFETYERAKSLQHYSSRSRTPQSQSKPFAISFPVFRVQSISEQWTIGEENEVVPQVPMDYRH